MATPPRSPPTPPARPRTPPSRSPRSRRGGLERAANVGLDDHDARRRLRPHRSAAADTRRHRHRRPPPPARRTRRTDPASGNLRPPRRHPPALRRALCRRVHRPTCSRSPTTTSTSHHVVALAETTNDSIRRADGRSAPIPTDAATVDHTRHAPRRATPHPHGRRPTPQRRGPRPIRASSIAAIAAANARRRAGSSWCDASAIGQRRRRRARHRRIRQDPRPRRRSQRLDRIRAHRRRCHPVRAGRPSTRSRVGHPVDDHRSVPAVRSTAPTRPGLGRDHVLVVDEAAMVGTRTLVDLVSARPQSAGEGGARRRRLPTPRDRRRRRRSPGSPAAASPSPSRRTDANTRRGNAKRSPTSASDTPTRPSPRTRRTDGSTTSGDAHRGRERDGRPMVGHRSPTETTCSCSPPTTTPSATSTLEPANAWPRAERLRGESLATSAASTYRRRRPRPRSRQRLPHRDPQRHPRRR